MSADLGSRRYVQYSDSIEKIPPGEADDIKAVCEQINIQQRQQFDNHRHVYTGTHCRTQGVVKGTFTVHDDIPKYLKQGELFAKGGEYPAACRYSTEPGDPGMDDRIPQPRGFSIKLFNVNGDFLPGAKDTNTQDIEFNNAPAIELADAKTTREIFDIRMNPEVGGPVPSEAMDRELNKRHDSDLQKARWQLPNTHLASLRQYSQSAFRFGDYVMKYCLVPNTATQKQLYSESVRPDSSDSQILSTWLRNFHQAHDAEYLFQVQLLENEAEQPVEYSGVPWDEEKYPWQTVATLRVPRQDPMDMKRKRFWEDYMRLDPWHGLKSYRPLGGSNRLRKDVYYASSKLRREMNGTEEVWITRIDEIPN